MIAIGFVLGILAACVFFLWAAIPSLSPEGGGVNPFKGVAFTIGLVLGILSALSFYFR